MDTGHRFLEDKWTRGISLARHWRTIGAKMARRDEKRLAPCPFISLKVPKKSGLKNDGFPPG